MKHTDLSDYDVHLLSLQHFGKTVKIQKYDGFDVNFTMWGSSNTNMGYDVAPKVINAVRPSVIMTMCDVGFQEGYYKMLKTMEYTGRWLAYTPVDDLKIEYWQEEGYKKISEIGTVVAMSKYGKRKLKEIGIKAEYVPHGVDPNVFKPLPLQERKKMRESVGLKGKWVVFSNALNQDRKMWRPLIEGFSIFARNKDDVFYLMHTDEKPSSERFGGWNISYLARKYKISNKAGFTHPPALQNWFWRYLFTDDMINKLYNSSMVYLAGGAEGFGLPTLEAQAAGIPVVAGDQTATSELIPYGFPVKIEYTQYGKHGTEFGIPSAEDIAVKLNKLYNDTSLRLKKAKQARKFALKYDWKDICKEWNRILCSS